MRRNRIPTALAAGLAVIVVLAGCGSSDSDSASAASKPAAPNAATSNATTSNAAAGASVTASGPMATAAAGGTGAGAVNTDYPNVPGMAMGAPPETSTMNCSDAGCDVVYIPPSTEITKPFGIAVKLVSANATQVVLTVAGKQVTLAPGKAVKASGLTVTVTGTPGTVVNLHFAKA